MKRAVNKWAAPVLCGLFIFALFRFVFFIGYVPSESMEPTIKAGSYIIGYRVTGEVKRGDILVFKHEGQLLVKRVAAVAGDVVYISKSGTIVLVNNKLPNAARILTVPENYYFMLGDNADASNDSRIWNEPFIKREQIIAKMVYFHR